jgi:hypothetical protein
MRIGDFDLSPVGDIGRRGSAAGENAGVMNGDTGAIGNREGPDSGGIDR